MGVKTWLRKRCGSRRRANPPVSLIKIRQPEVVKDVRGAYTLPTGAGEAEVLVCRGAGVWSDSTIQDVRFSMSVDADEELFVAFEAID